MTAEAKQKAEWIEEYVAEQVADLSEVDTFDMVTAYTKAHAAWLKHCEDGPSEMDNRDVGCHDLARSEGGMR